MRGATVEKSLQAAARLADVGAEVEVLDLRTIVPYDREAIATSVTHTRRLLVVHEDTLTGGFGAEIAAWAADELFEHLDAPIRRVAALDTHVPGLHIAFPSRAPDAAGLLRAAFAAEDPVLFLEHNHQFRQAYARDPYPGPDHVVPFGKGVIRRPGEDLTIVTWGATVQKSLQAAERLAEHGRSVEVLDLRTIVPYDRPLIAESVARTHRLLVVHEDNLTGGFGAEVAAWAADELWSALKGPIRRVAALDTPVPYEPTLLDVVLPQVEDIAAAAALLD